MDGWIRTVAGGGRRTLAVGGRWDLEAVARLDAAIAAAGPAAPGEAVAIDLSDLEALDTVGAITLRRLRQRLEAEGQAVSVIGAKPAHAALLAAAENGDAVAREARRPNRAVAAVEATGRATFATIAQARDMTAFLGLLMYAIGRLLRAPARLRITSLIHHMQQTGLNALPIVGLLSFLIGVVLAYQGAEQLRRFGAEVFVVNLLGISILREIGVLMTAIIIAGRSGSAITAQIGTMQVNQEVDAMRTLGLDPVDILVVPRILALMVTLPLLTFYANILGLLGGAVMSYAVLDITFTQFLVQLRTNVPISHFWVGMVKAPVFAFIIAFVGCYEGFKVSGTAESVGRLTTKSVVESIFLVIALDALFSIMFQRIGI